MPGAAPGDEVEKALNLLLHELRTPLSVAQGYLRLLLEDRLSDSTERQRAIARSMDALGRISDLCAGAGEFANAASPAEAHRYPVAELMMTLVAEAQAKGIKIDVADSQLNGQLRTLAPARAAAALVTVVLAALRHDSGRPPEMSAGVHADRLAITSGDAAMRSRLLASVEPEAFNPWRGGSGLFVALAVKQLRQTGARLWSLTGESSAVAIAILIESEG